MWLKIQETTIQTMTIQVMTIQEKTMVLWQRMMTMEEVVAHRDVEEEEEKEKKRKRKKRKKKITLVVQKTFDRNIKKSTSGRTMEKGSRCSKVEKKAENEKEQENKGT